MTCTLSCSGRSFCPVWRRLPSAVGQSPKRCTKATGSGADQGSRKRKEHIFIIFQHNLSFTFIFVNSTLPFVVNALTWDHSHSQRSNFAAGPADGSSYNNLSLLWAGSENVQLWGCRGDITHDALPLGSQNNRNMRQFNPYILQNDQLKRSKTFSIEAEHYNLHEHCWAIWFHLRYSTLFDAPMIDKTW